MLGLWLAHYGHRGIVWCVLVLKRDTSAPLMMCISSIAPPISSAVPAFDIVCCPNLSGEIIEWVGFALLTWSLPGLAFALWTVANLVPRALWRRKWYRENFSGYPRERAALFPGVL